MAKVYAVISHVYEPATCKHSFSDKELVRVDGVYTKKEDAENYVHLCKEIGKGEDKYCELDGVYYRKITSYCIIETELK